MDVDPIAVRGEWWRHARAGADPARRPKDPADNRWQTAAVVEGLYLGEHPETIWAEWYRAIAENGIPPDAALPRDRWRWEVDLADVADLSSRDRLDRIGLKLPLPGRGNWPPYQAAGNALFELGWKGLLAPSAARPEDLVLCLFRTEDEIPGAEPVPPPERIERPPLVPRGMRT